MQPVLCVLFAAGLAVRPGERCAGAGGRHPEGRRLRRRDACCSSSANSIKAAKADDATKTTATDLAKQGAQACNGHDYDAGMDQIHPALTQIGLQPAR